MEFDKLIEFLESYAQGYFSRLLLFLHIKSSEDEQHTAVVSHLWTYTFLSAALGVLLQGVTLTGLRTTALSISKATPFPTQGIFLLSVMSQMLFWIASAALNYGLLNLEKSKLSFDSVVAITLNLFSYSFVISSFVGVIFGKIALVFVGDYPDGYFVPSDFAPWAGYSASVLMQIYLMIRYFSAMLGDAGESNVKARWHVTAAMIAITMLVQLFSALDAARQTGG